MYVARVIARLARLLRAAEVWLGHPYMVMLVCLLQVGLFRELVNVRCARRRSRLAAMIVLPQVLAS